jgi:hypothetical protein
MSLQPAPAASSYQCYHCKDWVEKGAVHDCWTTTEAALTADLSEDLREAWERLRETAAEFGEQRIYASHHSIMFSRKSCYFFVRPKKSHLEVTIFLDHPIRSPQVQRVDQVSKIKTVNVIRIRHRDEVEAPFTDWLREAYELPDKLAAQGPRGAGIASSSYPGRSNLAKKATGARKSSSGSRKSSARKSTSRKSSRTAAARKGDARKSTGRKSTGRKSTGRKSTGRTSTSRKSTSRKSSAKRSEVKNRAGSFYAKRKSSGRFSEMDEKGRSLKTDRRRRAKTETKSGYGDQGDRRRTSSKKR